jgi:hypothetical protein
MDPSQPLFALDPFAADARRDEIEPVRSPALNGVRTLPAIIRPRQKAVDGD